ncbi:AraC family transcriptional regulator [Synoicihabitans lomoniglobus]|uniref:AraC family transcriptional regulator n=1 Tax=Synoicihabitans lomoniglobus TaxID=2909285 RepID=A0AAE9ZVS1_9BACT|nr:AraC family transcriptional regulator [Opitutaceae bacterium LMO-M01]WED64059.1 AraC family transcriptional regulator [Opitutaceae bacterium LMO-M01]
MIQHDHSFHEIVIVTAGSAMQSTAEGHEQLQEGTALILQPESSHSYKRSSGFNVVNIYYLAEWFLTDVNALRGVDHLFSLFFGSALFEKKLAAPIVRLDLNAVEFARLKLELQQMIQGEQDKRSLLYREACFLKILDDLANAYGRRFGRDRTRPVRNEVIRGLEVIERQAYKGGFHIAEVSRQAGLSINQFERLFRNHTGMKPIDYFQKMRLNHACRRLLNSGASIAEVAYEFNYSDAAHLNRYFRRFLSMTPGQYRQQYGVS